MLEEEWVDFQVRLDETSPKEVPMHEELPQQGEGNIWEETVIALITGGHIEIRDSLTEEGTQVEDPLVGEDILTEVGDPLIEVEGPLEEDTLMEMEDPLEEEDTLVEDPLMEEEGPLMEEDPLDLLEDKDHQVLKDLLGL